MLATLTGAAALLHALLLAGVTTAETSAGGGGGAPPAVAMRVRTLPAAAIETAAPPEGDVPTPAAAAVTVVFAAPVVPDSVARRSPRTGPRGPSLGTANGASLGGATGAATDAAAVSDTAVAANGAATGPEPGTAVQPTESPTGASAPPAAASTPPARAVDDAPAVTATSLSSADPASAGTARPATAMVMAVAAGASTHGTGASETGAGADPPSPHDDELPVYKTTFPPPLTLHYDLRRGLLGGSGTLAWRPVADHYEMRLEGRVAGLSVLTQVSQGGFDDAGIAPRRYTDQRLNRAPLAANFNREQGKITFSGPSTEFPLLVGTQDRLSWMIQLAAVVSAEPRRLQPGGKVAIYVVGARADASMWVFRCAGMETVDTASGAVHAARFTREPRSAHDTLAEAWLDPARHGLPVRARIGSGDGGDALELSLRDLQTP